MKNEIKQYLKDNLTAEIIIEREDNPDHELTSRNLSIKLDNEEISQVQITAVKRIKNTQSDPFDPSLGMAILLGAFIISVSILMVYK